MALPTSLGCAGVFQSHIHLGHKAAGRVGNSSRDVTRCKRLRGKYESLEAEHVIAMKMRYLILTVNI